MKIIIFLLILLRTVSLFGQTYYDVGTTYPFKEYWGQPLIPWVYYWNGNDENPITRYQGNIYSTSTMESNANVKYLATSLITLDAGFSAHIGANFTALITVSKRAGGENFDEELSAEDVITSAEETTLFRIYPNPNNGRFTITIENKESALIEVYDVMGKQVFIENTNEARRKINISNQPKGIYMVNITVGNNLFTEKVIYQ
jgi:hypothetical protein